MTTTDRDIEDELNRKLAREETVLETAVLAALLGSETYRLITRGIRTATQAFEDATVDLYEEYITEEWERSDREVQDDLHRLGMVVPAHQPSTAELGALLIFVSDLLHSLATNVEAKTVPLAREVSSGMVTKKSTVTERGKAAVNVGSALRAYSLDTVGLAGVLATNGRIEQAAAANPHATVQKRWTTRKDDRVRPAHKAADGQVRPVNQKFRVGGELMAYPKDPNASIDNIAGCRCRLSVVVAGGE